MKKLLQYIVCILLLTSCYTNNSTLEDPYQLVWQDEFDYNNLPDSTKWAFDTEGNEKGWGNFEAQHYTDANLKNANVENGILNITAIKESFKTKEFTSARLISKADWQYGKFERSEERRVG